MRDWCFWLVGLFEYRIAVFSKGTCTRLNSWIPVGGQFDPSSVVGNNLVWKNSQKNNTKNKNSQTINRIIPYRRTFVTIFVCNPWYVPSRVTSRHRWIIIIIKFTLLKTWNQHTVLICLCGKHLINDMGKKFLFLGSVGEGLYRLFIFGSHGYNDTCVRAACNFGSVYIFAKTTVSFFLSVCLSSFLLCSPHGTTRLSLNGFSKNVYWTFSLNLWKKFKCGWNQTRI